MQKIVFILVVELLFASCKPKVQATSKVDETTDYFGDTMRVLSEGDISFAPPPPPPRPAGKLAAKAIDEVEGKEGKKISFTYDNNASTVSFEWNGKQVVLTSKEKISDMPNANGITYSNDELTYNNKDGIKVTDKKGKLIFEEKQ